MTVCKGPILTYKSNKNPYYIELSNTNSLLAEFSTNLSITDQHISTDRKFKRKAGMRRQEKMNKQIDTNIIKAEYNDAAIINAAIKLADGERSARNKTTLHQRDQVGKANSTTTHKHNKSSTREGKHVQFKIKPSIATYKQHSNTPMIIYTSGADSHYLSKQDRAKLVLLILKISDKKVGVSNGGAFNSKYVTSLPFPQLSSKAAEADTFSEFPTSLMSVGKKSDDGNVSIFTKYGVAILCLVNSVNERDRRLHHHP